ncbi:MAG TPA: hypothetical protein QGH56_04910 [Candidatus Marinimicrobia bacterium]|nr:hypothetical protein [Candidatus Neomarinimicrobiota bacterium]
MGYILPEIYQSICQENNRELPGIFVETGTFKGGIPHRMLETYGTLDPFEKIYTIEISEDICKVASRRYKLFEKYQGDASKFNPHIDEKDELFDSTGEYFDGKLILINDDSVKGLKQLLPLINEPVCFWLDAHGGALRYSRGEVDCPLLEELNVIENHHIKNHIIAIDDAHMFGKIHAEKGEVVCDYTKITYDKVKQLLWKINPNYDIGMYEPYNMKMVLAL